MSELKAFAVMEDSENTGDIFFAKHAITALRCGANQLGDGDIGGWTARRAQWADLYAPGPIPKLVMIENGWWFDCGGCGVKIDSEYEAYDEDDNAIVLNPVERKAGVFCTEQCYLREQTHKAAIKAREAEAIEWLALELLHRHPGVSLTGENHSFCSERHGAIQQVVVGFTFPGSKIGPAHYRYEAAGKYSGLFVPAGDHDAWQQFRSPTPQAQE